MRHTKTLFILFFSVGSLLVSGQELPKSIPFEHLTIPGTIRSSEVTDILQDPEGLLWIAGDGLFRYDGVSFTHYKTLPDNSSIGSSEINSLFYDTLGNRLLISTRNKGVVEYNYASNSLRKLPSRDGIPIINSLAQTSDGKIWATSFSNGLFYLENDTLKKFRHERFMTSSLTQIFPLGENLLVGDISKIIVLRDDIVEDSIMLEWPNTNFTIYGRVTALAFGAGNKLYIGTEKEGMLIYDMLQKRFVKYFPPEMSPFYNRINRIFVDRDGLVWILTKSGGLVLYSPEQDRYVSVVRNPLQPESLAGDNCTSIIQDKTGIIWVGSTGDLNKYDPNKVQFQHITHNPFDRNSLSDKMVRGIFEDEDGRLLVGTDGGYINRINLEENSVEHLKVTLPDNTGVIVPLYFINFDKDHLLIGSNSGALMMNKHTGKFSLYEPLRHYFENKLVRQMIKHRSTLYLISSGTLYAHDLITKKTTKHENFTSEKNKRVTNATCIFLDSQERLWIGVTRGLSLLQPNNTFTHYEFEKNSTRPEGSYFMVLSIAEIDNKLWVGTFDAGLWQLDLKDGLDNPAISKPEGTESFANSTVYATLADDDGNVWISTNEGITKYETRQGRYTHFSISEGLQDHEFNRLAYFKTRSGLLAFGGINGINYFHPDKIKIKTMIPKPAILSVSGNHRPENEFFTDLRNRPNIRLASHQNYITFAYVIPNYQQPARFEAEYLLENQDVRWSPAINNQAAYTNLKPGEYTFKIRVKDADGNEQLDSIALTIDFPFWQRWWFVALAAGLIGISIYSAIRGYAAKTLRDKERLETLLKERTREIEKSHEALENLNQKKDLIFSILSHDLRGPLTTLKGFLSLIIENTDSLAKEDIKKYAGNIRNSVTSSLDLIDNTLFWSLSQTGSITYTPSYFSLADTLKKIHKLYQLTADKKQINFHVQVDGNIRVYADENMLYVALRNIVSNALKFTPEGKNVFIRAQENHRYAIIKITDEGVGMSHAYVEKLISEEQPMLKMGTSNEKGTGLGLVLCKKFINLNKGNLNISSVEKEGSEFTVTIPLSDQVSGLK
jgi:signal transduction histidine kinase/ligand-binding sensor domain-containing protein